MNNITLPSIAKEVASTAARFLANKAVLIGVLIAAMVVFLNLPRDNGKDVPFAELIYAAVMLVSVPVGASILRLLVFPEAATFAEKGDLRKTLDGGTTFTPALIHYWWCTTVCYIISGLCFTALLNIK